MAHRDRELLFEEDNHHREMFERAEVSARIPQTEIQTLSQQLNAARDNSAYLLKHDWLTKEIKHDWTSRNFFKKLKMRERVAQDGERQP